MEGMTGQLRDAARAALFEGELGRRLVHASGSAVPGLYLLGLATWKQVQLLFLVGAAVAVGLEGFRHAGNIDWRIFTYLTREYEQETVAGYVLYMLSSAAVAFAFEPQVAVPAILMLMLGDPISGLTASDEFRRIKRPRTLVTMFFVCVVIALPFVHEAPLAVLLGGLGGTLADGVKPIVRGHVIDDNLTIPPVAAIGLFVGLELTAAIG
jgi:dolichol kinase